MHAYWWNHSSVGGPIFKSTTEEELQIRVQQVGEGYSQFVDFLGDRLSKRRKTTYELIFEKLSGLLWNRLSAAKNQTLAHGDAHYWNFLFPNDRTASHCILFDWQTWAVELGARDLAYMIALNFYPERRQSLEQTLLKFYLEELQKQEIDYAWEELQTDYRAYVIFNLLYPILWHYHQVTPIVWWPRLENGFAAYEDLACVELL